MKHAYPPSESIVTPEDFNRFLRLQQSGFLHMYDSRRVCEEADLKEAQYHNIISHYEDYYKMWITKE